MYGNVVSLEQLYDFAERNPDIPSKKHGAWKDFSERVQRLTAEMPQKQGLYLWGYYEGRRFWRNVYLGKAGLSKKADLRKRITEELKDERCFLWRASQEEKDLLKIGRRLYPKMWKKYKNHWTRSLRKAPSTHIIWVCCDLGNRDVRRVEADLIETLNPVANLQRSIPPASLQPDTSRVLRFIRKLIHEKRQQRSPVRLA